MLSRNKCFYVLAKILESQFLSRETFLHFINTLGDHLWYGDVALKENKEKKTNGFWKKNLKEDF